MNQKPFVHSQLRKPARAARGVFYRPGLEELEDRIAPAAVDFKAIATQLDQQLAGLTAPGSLLDTVKQSEAVLPIVNKSLASQASRMVSAVNRLRTAIIPVISSLDASTGQAAIRKALFGTGVIRDTNNNGADENDVLIPSFDPANGNITITAHLGYNLLLVSKNFTFDLGLPGVPFGLDSKTELTVSADVDYDRLSFGMRNGQFFVESPGGKSTLKMGISADAKQASLVGTIGFFQVIGKAMAGAPAVHVGASLTADANVLSLSNPRMEGSAQINLNLDARLRSNGTGLTFPHMVTDFAMNWSLGGRPDVKNREGLGSAPTVEFRNVQFGLGSYLGEMVQPFVDYVQQGTKPLAPLYKVMAAPIPGLSRLGAGDISINDLIKLAINADVLPPDYQLGAELLDNLHNLITKLQGAKFGPKNDVLIPIGSFDLGESGDLRLSKLARGLPNLKAWLEQAIKDGTLTNLNTLAPHVVALAGNIKDTIKNHIADLHLPSIFQEQVDDVFQTIEQQLNKARNGVGLKFPLIENPEKIFRLLLGQDVDFLRFDFFFSGQAKETQEFSVYGPVKAGFTGAIDITTQLHAGIDTFGLRQFFISVLNGNADAALLDDGLYVDNGGNPDDDDYRQGDLPKPLVKLTGSIDAKAGIDFEYGEGLVLHAFLGFTGGLHANDITISFVDPNKRGDHKLRLLASGEIGDNLFTVSGSLTADFAFHVEVGARVEIPIIHKVIVDGTKTVFDEKIGNVTIFSAKKDIDVDKPVLQPSATGGSVDVGFDANFEDNRDVNIMFVEAKDGIVSIWYNGQLKQSYPLSTVSSVQVVGSDYSTAFVVRGAFGKNKPVSVTGGSDFDGLDFDDTQNDKIANPIYVVHSNSFELDSTLFGGFILPITHIDFENMEDVDVRGSADRKNLFLAYDTFVPTALVAGDAGSTFRLGLSKHRLDKLLNLKLVGGKGDDQAIVYDDGVTGKANYTIDHDSIDRSLKTTFYSQYLPGGSADYAYFFSSIGLKRIDAVQLYGAKGGNNIVVNDIMPPPPPPLPGDDTLELPPVPLRIDLFTGLGDDTVTIKAITASINVQGRAGNDTVTVGAAGSGTDLVFGSVNVSNDGEKVGAGPKPDFGSATGIIVDDTGSTAPRTTYVSGNDIDDFNDGPYRVHFIPDETDSIVIKGGNGGDTFYVNDTPVRRGPLKTTIPTPVSITTGNNANTIYVKRTQGPVLIESNSALNDIRVGDSPKGMLGSIKGALTIRGVAAGLSLDDRGTTDPKPYVMEAGHFYRTDKPTAGIFYDSLSLNNVGILLGDGGNQVSVKGTPKLRGEGFVSEVSLFTGNDDDIVNVLGTDAPLSVDLGKGRFYQSIGIGDSFTSLDAIHGQVNVEGGGNLDVVVSNGASTEAQTTAINSVGLTDPVPYQSIKRMRSNGEELNSFNITFDDHGHLNYSTGQGGDTVFVHGTPAAAGLNLSGGAGVDVFWIEMDKAPLLSPVYVSANAATGDYAYYYDYLETTPQTYTFLATPSRPRKAPNNLDLQVVQRTGAADVTYTGIRQLVTYTAQANGRQVEGGNQVYVQGVPTPNFLNMVAGDKDKVVLGNVAPSAGGTIGINGSLARILGGFDVGYGKQVTVTVDDSGDTTARNVGLHPKRDGYGDFITGMAPGDPLYFRLGEGSSVNLKGGKGSDTFAMTGIVFDSAMSIDGGEGNNTLDFSGVPNPSSVGFDMLTGTASGLAGGFKRINQVTGVP